MKPAANDRFTIELTSVPDRDGLVAEVWLQREQLAELRREHDELRVQIYPRPSDQPWDIPWDQLLDALQAAREKLEDR